MRNTFKILFGISAILLTAVACEEDAGCQSSAEASLRAGFFIIVNDTAEADTIINDFTLQGVGVSELINDSTEASSALLPLNPFTDESSFILKFNNIADTLTFGYSRSLEIISEECGYITIYSINDLATTYNGIDSIALIESNVTLENVQHVKIYF